MAKKEKWLMTNANYWDLISLEYEELYNSKWSKLENNQIKKKLSFITQYNNVNILDLGCGTGQGYSMCLELNSEINYVGVDISSKMISIFKSKHGDVKAFHNKMSDLSGFDKNSFDVVISIFTSFSYTDDIHKTMSEIERVLKPDGTIFLSVLNKNSLRRRIKRIKGRIENYYTRGSKHQSFTKAWALSKKDVKFMLQTSGFAKIKIEGYNPLGGILENSYLWKINLLLAKLFPYLSHELLITAKLEKSDE